MVIGTLYSCCNVTLGEIMFPFYIAAGFVRACLDRQTFTCSFQANLYFLAIDPQTEVLNQMI